MPKKLTPVQFLIEHFRLVRDLKKGAPAVLKNATNWYLHAVRNEISQEQIDEVRDILLENYIANKYNTNQAREHFNAVRISLPPCRIPDSELKRLIQAFEELDKPELHAPTIPHFLCSGDFVFYVGDMPSTVLLGEKAS